MHSHRQNSKLIIMMLLFIILILTGIYAYREYQIVKIHKYPINADFSTNPKLGLTATADLNFGRVPIDLMVTRVITLNNTYGIPIIVIPEIKGNISPYMLLETDTWRLKPNEVSQLNVSVYLPDEKPLGNYTGTLILYVRRA